MSDTATPIERNETKQVGDTVSNMPPANGATMQLWCMYQAGAPFEDMMQVAKSIYDRVRQEAGIEDLGMLPQHVQIVLRSIALAVAGSILVENEWLDPAAREFDIELCFSVMPHSVHWWPKLPNEPKPCPRIMELYNDTEDFIIWYIGQLGDGRPNNSAPSISDDA